MLTLKGLPAFSSFRLDKVSSLLRPRIPGLRGLIAEYWHFAEVDGQLNQDEVALFDALLEYGPQREPINPQGELLLVVPRVGTISAWSTKASEIARYCGLSKIKRVERGIAWYLDLGGDHLDETQHVEVAKQLHDPMTESVLADFGRLDDLFRHSPPQPLSCIDLSVNGIDVLQHANQTLGLALSAGEVKYLFDSYKSVGRNPTDIELMMFAQINSEHCRHKIFNAEWVIDGQVQTHSLFSMIRETHRQNSAGTIVAYSDNAAVIEGVGHGRWLVDPNQRAGR